MMELEQRLERLEKEVGLLKGEIQETLLNVQKNLSPQPTRPSRWQKRAWGLALLNVLLAITLFTNIRFYTSDGGLLGGDSTLNDWLRGFWIALAFLWLLLQMYPLALLLDQEDEQSREMGWRKAAAIFRSNPGLTLALTLLVLVPGSDRTTLGSGPSVTMAAVPTVRWVGRVQVAGGCPLTSSRS